MANRWQDKNLKTDLKNSDCILNELTENYKRFKEQ